MNKQFLLISLFIAISISAFSQTGSITNIQVSQQTDNIGLVDVYFDLSGPDGSYYLNMSVSFDGGSTFTPIGSTFLSEDIGPINPGTNKYIIWDGGQSFPDTYSMQSQLKIIAIISNGIDGEPCPGTPTVTDIDGNTYNTIQIGTQCWMKENLNVGIRINGSQYMSDNSMIEKYCYNDNSTNCETYGGLYQWNEMMQYITIQGEQGICPSGWHLPTDDEWKIMEMQLGMSQSQADNTSYRGTNEGGKMKKTGITNWNPPNTGATNTSNFTALPGGDRYSTGLFHFIGQYGSWWTSTEYSSPSRKYSWYRTLHYNSQQVYRYKNRYKYDGCSVRCLKD